MQLNELCALLGINPELLVEKAKEFGIELLENGGEVDPEIVALLKEKLSTLSESQDQKSEEESSEIYDKFTDSFPTEEELAGLSTEFDAEKESQADQESDEDEEDEVPEYEEPEEDEEEQVTASDESDERADTVSDATESEEQKISEDSEEEIKAANEASNGNGNSEEADLLGDEAEEVLEDSVTSNGSSDEGIPTEEGAADDSEEDQKENVFEDPFAETATEEDSPIAGMDLEDDEDLEEDESYEYDEAEEAEEEDEESKKDEPVASEDGGLISEEDAFQMGEGSVEESVEAADIFDEETDNAKKEAAQEKDSTAESTESVEPESVSDDEKAALNVADEKKQEEPVDKKEESSAFFDEDEVEEEKEEEEVQKKEADELDEQSDEEEQVKGPGFVGQLIGGLSSAVASLFSNKLLLFGLLGGALFSAVLSFAFVQLFMGKQQAQIEEVIEEKTSKLPQVNLQEGERGEEELFKIIWETYKQGYYNVSYKYALEFIEAFPGSDLTPDVYYKLGDIHYHWKRESDSFQYKKARSAYEQAMALHPENSKMPWAMFQVGNTYYEQRLFADAEKVYRKVIENYPTFQQLDRVRYKLGLVYLLQDDFERSRLEFKRMIDTFPKSVYVNNALLRIAETYYQQNNYSEAVKSYLNYIEKYPNSPKQNEVFFRIAKLSQASKNYDAAIIYYKKSLGKYPYDQYNPLAKLYIGNCWYYLGNYEKARAAYVNIIEMYDEEQVVPMASFKIADTYLKEEKYHLAIDSYKSALEKFPNSPDAKVGAIKLGEIYFKMKQYEDLIELYSDLISAEPNYFGNDRLILRIAQSYFNQGKFLDASEWFLEIIKNYPTSDLVRMAYFGKAKSEEKAQYVEKAIDSYQSFVVNFPDHPRADFVLFQIGNMFFDIDKYDEAIDYYENLRSKYAVSEFRFPALLKIGQAYKQVYNSEVLLKEWGEKYGINKSLEELRAELIEKSKQVYAAILENPALEGTDEFFEAIYEMADYYIDSQSFDLALNTLDRGLDLYSGETRVYRLLRLKGHLTYELDMLEETVRTYEDLIAVLTEALDQDGLEIPVRNDYLTTISEAYIALGDMLYAQDNFAEALYIYLEGIEKMPKDDRRPWPFYQVANCYNRLNNYEKANFYYDKVKKEFPDNFWNEYIGWNKDRMTWEKTLKENTTVKG